MPFPDCWRFARQDGKTIGICHREVMISLWPPWILLTLSAKCADENGIVNEGDTCAFDGITCGKIGDPDKRVVVPKFDMNAEWCDLRKKGLSALLRPRCRCQCSENSARATVEQIAHAKGDRILKVADGIQRLMKDQPIFHALRRHARIVEFPVRQIVDV